jgi:hypothetical protein
MERGINSLLQLFAVEPTGCSIIFSVAEYGNTTATFLLPSDNIRAARLLGIAASFRTAMKAEDLYVVPGRFSLVPYSHLEFSWFYAHSQLNSGSLLFFFQSRHSYSFYH